MRDAHPSTPRRSGARERRYPVDRQLIKLAEAVGLPLAELAERTGLKSAWRRPRPRLSSADFNRTYGLLLAQGPTRDLVETVRQLANPDRDSAASVALFSSPTLDIACERLGRLRALSSPLRLRRCDAGEQTRVELSLADPAQAGWIDIALIELLQFSLAVTRMSAGRCAPVAVGLPDAHGANPALSAAFELPQARSDVPSLVFDATSAALPFASTGLGWAQWQPPATPGERPLRHRVQERLAQLLPAGEARVEAVAAKLAMSKRTLQRQLAADGTHYQALLDELRADMAEAYRRQGLYTAAETATLLAYNDLQSFQRARRRWHRQPAH